LSYTCSSHCILEPVIYYSPFNLKTWLSLDNCTLQVLTVVIYRNVSPS